MNADTCPYDHALHTRADLFFAASLATSYPDAALATGLLAAPTDVWGEALAVLAQMIAAPGGLDCARSLYLELFDRGGGRASLYETEYGRMRGMAKGNDLADIAGFYHAFGLVIDAELVHEMADHIAVELEFYGVLLLKESALVAAADGDGVEIVQDARQKFVTEHLGRLARAVAQRSEVRSDLTYGPVFDWAWQLVATECTYLGIEPPLLDYFGDDELKRSMECGAVHLPVVQ